MGRPHRPSEHATNPEPDKTSAILADLPRPTPPRGDCPAAFGLPDDPTSPASEETSPADATTRLVAPAPPQRIGPFRVLGTLGEGGMGVVYLAEQTEPIRRRVALKLIKLGMDTKDVVARFEAERQALALMTHANVAAVYEAGATDTGRPYFVMEYVPGQPITRFCDGYRLSIRERIELVIQVCLAVQHAHQKGIIHRDIKPSNVLVARVDGRPTPKVIDFGVAKATTQRLTEHTLDTGFGQPIGTPDYMSPEQSSRCSDGLDARTDVYSLGVLLYALLTGRLPFELAGQRGAGLLEMQRIIREVEPPLPSARVRQLSEQAARDVAATRRLDPRGLRRTLRGDLDAVVLRALEKDRERRYSSAAELANDLHRYLAGLPVLTRRPSPLRHAAKFARRRRVGLAACLALTTLLAAALWLAAVLNSAQHELRQRDAHLLRAEAQQLYAGGDYAAALKKLALAIRLAPDAPEARLLRAACLMGMFREDQAAAELHTLTRDSRPDIAGAAHRLLARLALHDDAAAQRHSAQARRLGDAGDADYLNALVSREPAEAIALLTRVIERDPGHFDAIMLRSYWHSRLGDYASALRDSGLARTLRPRDPGPVTNLGVANRFLGNHAAAETRFREALRLEPTYWYAQKGLADVLWQSGRQQEALDGLKQSIRDHPGDWEPVAVLAERLRSLCRWGEALDCYHRLESIDPADPRWPLGAGWMHQQLADWPRALLAFERAAACPQGENAQPRSLAARRRAMHEIAWTCLVAPDGAGRDADRAAQRLAELRREAPDDNLLNSEALLAYRRGELSEARRLALDALSRQPDSLDAAYPLTAALCEAALGNLSEASTLCAAGGDMLRRSPDQCSIGSDLLARECAALLEQARSREPPRGDL